MIALADFLATYAALRELDAQALLEAGVLRRGEARTFRNFRSNPALFLQRADRATQRKLWALAATALAFPRDPPAAADDRPMRISGAAGRPTS